MTPILRALSATAALMLTALPAAAAEPSPRAKPRLVVVISVDQFSAGLFGQWRGRLPGGFKTLTEAGVVYAQGFQSHGMTETCPGHSTMLTGRHPAATGITANDWRDPATGDNVYCVSAPGYALAHETPDGVPVGPVNLKVDTLGDWLKAASPQSRVVAVAGKDRSAVLLGGQHPDGVFWYARDLPVGRGGDGQVERGWGLTTYVAPGQSAADRMARMAAFNAAAIAARRRKPPAWTYREPSCRRLAASYSMNGWRFDSRLPPSGWAAAPGPAGQAKYLSASPMFDQMVIDAADQAIRAWRLGEDDAPDLLAVGLSATDYIGHRYGTQGPEMCEQMHRLDALLGRFLRRLKAVDPNVLVVLTADHGGSDFPERARARGFRDAGRVPADWLDRFNPRLRAEFGLKTGPLADVGGDPSQLYLIGETKTAMAEPLRSRVLARALELIRADEYAADAFSLDALLAAPRPRPGASPQELTLSERMAMSAVAGRSGDTMVAIRERVTTYRGAEGGYISGHGTPWDYDRAVPIVFWRPGLAGEERVYPADTTDIAPTLAAALGLTGPDGLDGRCLAIEGLADCRNPSPLGEGVSARSRQ